MPKPMGVGAWSRSFGRSAPASADDSDWTPLQLRFIELHIAGLTVRQIADRTGCSPANVRDVLRRFYERQPRTRALGGAA